MQDYIPPYTAPKTNHYDRTFGKTTSDDEYWGAYINEIRGERTDSMTETEAYLSDQRNYAIEVKTTEDNRVQIEFSRDHALDLYESLGKEVGFDSYSVAGTLRRLLGDYFVTNKDVASDGVFY